MSDTTIHAQEVQQFRTFVSVEHGTRVITLSWRDTLGLWPYPHGVRAAYLDPRAARELAADLMRRADDIEGVKP